LEVEEIALDVLSRAPARLDLETDDRYRSVEVG
jgi:hypothetical protein